MPKPVSIQVISTFQMRLISVITSFIFLSTIPAYSQQLIINEISQGTGSQEYVELVVTGTPTCQTPVPTVDLRGIIIDDNNGYFNPASGTGIATGAIRFSTAVFWSAIPQGTIIVIRSDTDPNPAVPALDNSISDGNCKIILAANSTLLEGQATAPALGDPTYPANGTWIAGSGTWAQVAMANGNDSFQIRQNISSAAPSYSVSWGNNTNGAQISFSSATGSVFSFMNTTSNNSLIQGNWTEGTVATDQTPGLPNNTLNSAWIGSMNPECSNINAISITLNPVNSQCGASCTGAVSSTVSGGTTPYSYSWSTGSTSNSITNQCPGNYTLTVTDAGGCSHSESTSIGQNSTLSAQINVVNESCSGSCDGQATGNATGGTSPYSFSWSNTSTNATITDLCPGNYSLTVTDQNGCSFTANSTVAAGQTPPSSAFNAPGTHLISDGTILIASNGMGTWTSECGACLSANGVFDPVVSGTGTFEVCYTTAAGICTSTTCNDITITNGCVDQESFVNLEICNGMDAQLNGETFTTPGQYEQHLTLAGGCDSALYITVFQCINTDYTLEIPNVITPNGDQVNDLWKVNFSGVTFESGTITNRWGQVIQSLAAPTIVWDGKNSDAFCSEGVYFYQLKFKTVTGEIMEKQGFIELYR